MALRTFKNNPSLGGFGNESGLIFLNRRNDNTNDDDKNDDYSFQHEKDSSSISSPTEIKSDPTKKNKQQSTITATTSEQTKEVKSNERQNLVKITSSYQSGCGDAFSQIVKELVDNAIDACGSSTTINHSHRKPQSARILQLYDDNHLNNDYDKTNHYHSVQRNIGKEVSDNKKDIKLKRVRVNIEKVVSTNGNMNEHAQNEQHHSFKDDTTTIPLELLRVTVSDNGCGMEDIEKCVSVFSSTKGTEVDDNANNKSTEHISKSVEQAAMTTGRYGIGLTLCLLHAQRLVPNSCASITSAVSSSEVWTRASFIVDTDNDVVVCVKKENLSKMKTIGESGTAVSLLLPGGDEARRAWPRLAEYFARFQLSFGLECSLEVMAPSLSSKPLFIRPPVEIRRRFLQREEKRQLILKANRDDDDGQLTQDVSSSVCTHESKNDDVNKLGCESLCNEEDWNDDILNKRTCNSNKTHAFQNQSNISVPIDDDEVWCDEINPTYISDDDLAHINYSASNGLGNKNKNAHSNRKDEEEFRLRHITMSAASVYLNKTLQIENIAYSIETLRRNIDDRVSNAVLEVAVIVHGQDNLDEQDIIDTKTVDSVQVPKYDADQSKAKVMLVRMVNHIPLLDSTEASACGLVQGMNRMNSMWNSFGLDLEYKSSNEYSTNSKQEKAGYISMTETVCVNLYIPTYSLSDNAQVAPFFNRCTNHRLYEENEADSDSSEYPSQNADAKIQKRKRKQLERSLLPAGLRLGNVLIIAHIYAKASEVPLPTLSKGRLPMNDEGIETAFESSLSKCLRSLQKTNPSLLLTTNQLKRTERDARFIPSFSSALASLLNNCDDEHLQMKMSKRINNFNTKETIPTPTAQKPIVSKISHGSSNLYLHQQIAYSIELRLRNIITKIELERQDLRKEKERDRKKQSKQQHQPTQNSTASYRDHFENNSEKDFDEIILKKSSVSRPQSGHEENHSNAIVSKEYDTVEYQSDEDFIYQTSKKNVKKRTGDSASFSNSSIPRCGHIDIDDSLPKSEHDFDDNCIFPQIQYSAVGNSKPKTTLFRNILLGKKAFGENVITRGPFENNDEYKEIGASPNNRFAVGDSSKPSTAPLVDNVFVQRFRNISEGNEPYVLSDGNENFDDVSEITQTQVLESYSQGPNSDYVSINANIRDEFDEDDMSAITEAQFAKYNFIMDSVENSANVIPDEVMDTKETKTPNDTGIIPLKHESKISSKDIKWLECFAKLVAYQETHGFSKFPKSYKHDPSLGRWVAFQRRQYRLRELGLHYSITDERIHKLESIGFDWSPKISNDSWQDCFSKLVAYQETHGSSKFPKNWKHDPPLGRWVAWQRRQYRLRELGRPHSITDERIHKLESIGFDWNPGLSKHLNH